jgi:hypothetical protein
VPCAVVVSFVVFLIISILVQLRIKKNHILIHKLENGAK